jgi:hypothetical protein
MAQLFNEGKLVSTIVGDRVFNPGGEHILDVVDGYKLFKKGTAEQVGTFNGSVVCDLLKNAVQAVVLDDESKTQ